MAVIAEDHTITELPVWPISIKWISAKHQHITALNILNR